MRHCAAFIFHVYKSVPSASHSRVKSSTRECWLRSTSWECATYGALGIRPQVPTETGLWGQPLYPLPETSATPCGGNHSFSNLSNCEWFCFYDHLHQVCRPAKRPGFSFHGHKYLTSFLKLDLDSGSKCRAPTLVKHATPVPKKAQHSSFSSSYPFDLIPCTALLALRLLYHSVVSAEQNDVRV